MPVVRGLQNCWNRLGPDFLHLSVAGALSLVTVACFSLVWVAPDRAGDKTSDKTLDTASDTTLEGREILMRMADFLAKAPKWSVTLHTAYDAVQRDGSKIEWDEVRAVTLSRPDHLRVESERSDGAHSLIVFNGREITTFDEQARVYAQISHPGTVDDAIVYFVHDLRMRLPLAILLLEHLPAELQQRVQSVEYVEKNVTLGAPARHIAGKTATVDFQLWIAEGARPVPLRAVLTYKDAPGQPEFRAQFSDWKLDINPPDTLFSFVPPSGVNKIPFAAAVAKVVPAGQGGTSAIRGKQ